MKVNKTESKSKTKINTNYKSKTKINTNYKTKTKKLHKTKKLPKNNKTHKHKNHNIYHSNSLHFQHKFYDRKSDFLKFQYTPSSMKLKGGKYIDKGGFGCVLSPAIPCSRTDKNLNKSVSKIIKHETDSLKKEIKLSNILNKLDPEHNFFITIDKYCFINEIPENRTDLTNVKYKNDNLKKYSINTDKLINKYGKKKKIDKQFCDIDLDLKPVNLIMPYAGISLSSIMKTNLKSDNIKSKMHQMFIDNLKIYFKHLIIGVIKMHNNRIVNKDIKLRNIMLLMKNENKNTNEKMNDKTVKSDEIMAIRYIDFGLSELLTKEFCENINNIELKGTPYYLSPELFICAFINKYKDHSEIYQKNKIMQYITKYVEKTLSIFGENQIIAKLNSTINLLYKKIKYLYDKDKLLLAYFGSDNNKFNGYLQKADVYALGISIYETLYKYSEINIKKNDEYKILYDLLLHMIDMDSDKRYNIIQCLSHPYFTGKIVNN